LHISITHIIYIFIRVEWFICTISRSVQQLTLRTLCSFKYHVRRGDDRNNSLTPLASADDIIYILYRHTHTYYTGDNNINPLRVSPRPLSNFVPGAAPIPSTIYIYILYIILYDSDADAVFGLDLCVRSNIRCTVYARYAKSYPRAVIMIIIMITRYDIIIIYYKNYITCIRI